MSSVDSSRESDSQHHSVIVEQFTRQAAPFAQMHTAEPSMELFKQVARVCKDDVALDVACGPGLVACAFARAAKHVTGVDITPAMIEQATELQARDGLTNVAWKLGSGTALPFADGSFSLVLSRYAFHHFPDPRATLKEMARVCEAGGRVCVADVYVTSDEQDEAYNRVELIRDPSHVRALRLGEFKTMYKAAGLKLKEQAFYRFDVPVEKLLQATRTPEKEARQFREIVEADIGRNLMARRCIAMRLGNCSFRFRS